MSNDDSFNDSDELCSLYSSKKITDTFKAQLKKIAASSLPSKNIEVSCSNKNKVALYADGLETVFENVKKKSEVRKCSEIIEVDTSDSSIRLYDNDSLDDSIEVISESAPRRCTRQSERLRKKRGETSESNNSWAYNLSKTRNKKGRKRKVNQKSQLTDEITLEDSPQSSEAENELNPEMSVKVIWKSIYVKKFKMRKFQKLSYIYELLSKEEGIPEKKIMLTFNSVRVNCNDTPASLNLQVYHFLDGGVLTELTNSFETSNNLKFEGDSDSVVLKFQDVSKRIVKLNLSKKEKLKVGMIKCSEQLEVPLEKIKFYFDGELLNPSETPASLGLENEEIIDIKICN